MANREDKGSVSQTTNGSQVVVVKQKSAILVILMYVFSGGFLGYIGVDRFYKGDYVLGFIKLFMGSIGIIVVIIYGVTFVAGAIFTGEMIGFSLGAVALGVVCIYLLWVFIDFFLVPISIMIKNARQVDSIKQSL
ncbi:NINE protein [Helicobacter bilis]|uniref:TM2 domain-containing protein n=2 Tax=Helicobacter bilis TaxID=37372 RepID=A0A6D2C920_9HELI|nr:NINE protein [Helicobacter bilis]EMZ40804.1 hypothetical protein C826_00638 [Helicobacter bilis WiWa]TLE03124.1 TM2 domain-containing protein [Helicobacter bilis]TLE04074.1 TM2 domain-containing protein [Helicobacter bilis]